MQASAEPTRSPPGGGAVSLPLWPLLVFALLLGVKLVDLWQRLGFQVKSGYSPFAILGFVVFEDGSILGALLLVLIAGGRWPRLSQALAAAVLLAYSADVFLIHALFRRLTVTNLLQYAGEVEVLASFLTPAFYAGAPLVLLVAWWTRKLRTDLSAAPMVTAAACLVVAPWALAATRAVDPYLELTLPNVLRLNTQLVVRRGVSDESFERAKERFPELWARLLSHTTPGPLAGSPGSGPERGPERGGRSLIVLVSESLSRVDSKRSGGLYDRLPGLDSIAARGATFTDLVSDGNNTTEALAALLAAEEPFPTPVLSGSMSRRYPLGPEARHRSLHDSLPEQARARGDATAFLSNAPLAFQGNGAWLERLGFGRVEGGEARYYDGQPRYSFGSPPDEALFTRALEVLASARRRPILLVLLTVSLHGPYRTPDEAAGQSPLGTALGYVDRTTAAFYRRLERSGFFKSGHLLVVGDHRRMTPLEPRERRELGVDSLGRVFGCLVGPSVPAGSYVGTPLNLSDLYELAVDLSGGSFELARGFDRYNKGERLRLGTLFTLHLLSGGRGLVRVRGEGIDPYTMEVAASADPLAVASGDSERRIAAYVVLATGLLERRQEEAGP